MIRFTLIFCTDHFKALNLHSYTVKRRRAPQREYSDETQIKNDKELFDSTLEVLGTYQKKHEIDKQRKRHANISFFKEAVPYLLFCILLSAGTFKS